MPRRPMIGPMTPWDGDIDLVTLANECRQAGRALAYIGIRDDSPAAHALGVDLEARGNRALRQVGAG